MTYTAKSQKTIFSWVYSMLISLILFYDFTHFIP